MNRSALVFWSRLIQAATAVMLGLSTLLLAASTGEAVFNVVIATRSQAR